jgi:hypothetical protein
MGIIWVEGNYIMKCRKEVRKKYMRKEQMKIRYYRKNLKN